LFGLANKQGGAAPMGQRYWAGGLPSVEMDPDYASFASQILDRVDVHMKAWDRKRPLFLAPQLNANVAGLDEFKKVVDALKGNAEVTFVRADQLFQLMRAASPNPIGLAPGPDSHRAWSTGPVLLFGSPLRPFGRGTRTGCGTSGVADGQAVWEYLDVSGRKGRIPLASGAWIEPAR
jgi:hypothetical protein